MERNFRESSLTKSEESGERKMRKGLTEIVFILDRSGSMGGLESDTIGGFNSMISRQKKEKGEALVSTVLFDNVSEVLYDRVPMEKVPEMTDKDYYVRGCTALLDAIGGAIHHIGNIHKYARDEDRPEKTLFIITTDGLENSSRQYSYDKVKKMVERKQKKYGWEFLFIGANMDAVREAGRFGIKADRAADYVCDEKGSGIVYEAMNKAVSVMRMAPAGQCGQAMEASAWNREIQADFQKRGRGKRAGRL